MSAGDDCSQIQSRIERKEDYLDMKAYQRKRRCPDGYVEYCDERMKGCGARRKKPSDEFICMSQADIKIIFQ